MMDSVRLSGSRMLDDGAAGFIGSHLVERLLDEGAQVVGVDSFEDYYPRPLKEATVDARTRRLAVHASGG